MDPLSLLVGVALGGAGGLAWPQLKRSAQVWAGGLRVAEAGSRAAGAGRQPPGAFEPLEPTLGMLAWVEDALRQVHDYAYLGEQPLAGLQVVERQLEEGATRLERGRAVQSLLARAIESLRPAGQEPAEPGRAWWPYLVLRDCYLGGHSRREIMMRLFISEGTYNRSRRRAVRGLAKALRDLELQARGEVLSRPGA